MRSKDYMLLKKTQMSKHFLKPHFRMVVVGLVSPFPNLLSPFAKTLPQAQTAWSIGGKSELNVA